MQILIMRNLRVLYAWAGGGGELYVGGIPDLEK